MKGFYSLKLSYPDEPIGRFMAIEIVQVEVVQDRGITVTFSDGTSANYVAKELLNLRPRREINEQLQRAILAKS